MSLSGRKKEVEQEGTKKVRLPTKTSSTNSNAKRGDHKQGGVGGCAYGERLLSGASTNSRNREQGKIKWGDHIQLS